MSASCSSVESSDSVMDLVNLVLQVPSLKQERPKPLKLDISYARICEMILENPLGAKRREPEEYGDGKIESYF